MRRLLLPLSLCFAATACAPRYPSHARCVTGAAHTAGRPLDDSEVLPVAGAPMDGPADAPVTIVAFGDFQCPYCARGRVVMHDLRELFPTAVRVVWRDLPLARHDDAPLAAEAAREAFAQGGDALFWRYHDVLFGHPGSIDRPHLERYAEALGMDLSRFRTSLDQHVHRAGVEADMALGERLEIDSTPTFFVNGTPVAGAQPIEVFEALIRLNLERAGALSAQGRYAEAVRNPIAIPNELLPPDAYERVHTLAIPTTSPSRGPSTAPVTVQIFSDFECPYCGRVEPTLAELRSYYGERVRWVWRDFPLSRHARAQDCAEAGREVYAQQGSEGFWRFHDALFAHQREPGGLSPEALERYATAQGIDLARYRHAMETHVHQAAVQADQEAAEATGIRMGTPAFFINGHFFSGARPAAEFQSRIDPLLRSAR